MHFGLVNNLPLYKNKIKIEVQELSDHLPLRTKETTCILNTF